MRVYAVYTCLPDAYFKHLKLKHQFFKGEYLEFMQIFGPYNNEMLAIRVAAQLNIWFKCICRNECGMCYKHIPDKIDSSNIDKVFVVRKMDSEKYLTRLPDVELIFDTFNTYL